MDNSVADPHEFFEVLVALGLHLLKLSEDGVRHGLWLFNLLLILTHHHSRLEALIRVLNKHWLSHVLLLEGSLIHQLLLIATKAVRIGITLLDILLVAVVAEKLHLALLDQGFIIHVAACCVRRLHIAHHLVTVPAGTAIMMIEFVSELLQLKLILCPHFVGLLNTFFAHPADLPTQNFAELLNPNAAEIH